MSDRLALVDIDGLVADTRHRDAYAINRDWGTYFSMAGDDGLWQEGFDLVEKLEMIGYDIAWLTGRREDMRPLTEKWLRKKGFPDFPLIMRKMEDRTKLALLKAGVIFDASLLYPDGVLMYDDDPWVIEEADNVLPGSGRHCTWYVKPASVVRRAVA